MVFSHNAKCIVYQVVITSMLSSKGNVIISNQLFILLSLYDLFVDLSSQHFNEPDLNDFLLKMHYLELIVNSMLFLAVIDQQIMACDINSEISFFVDQACSYAGIQCDITCETLSFFLVRRHPVSYLLFRQVIKLQIQCSGSALGERTLDYWLI